MTGFVSFLIFFLYSFTPATCQTDLVCPPNSTVTSHPFTGSFCRCNEGLIEGPNGCEVDEEWCYNRDNCPANQVCCRFAPCDGLYENRCEFRLRCLGMFGCGGPGFEVPFPGCPSNAKEIKPTFGPLSCQCNDGFEMSEDQTRCRLIGEVLDCSVDKVACCGQCLPRTSIQTACPETSFECLSLLSDIEEVGSF